MKAVALCTEGDYLYPIYDKKIIDYLIDTLENIGIRELVIVFSQFTHRIDKTMQYIIDKSDLNVVYKYTKSPRCIVDNIELVKSFVGENDFLVIDANNIFLDNLKLRKPPCLYLSSSNSAERFNVVEFYGENIKNIERKPEEPKSKMVDTSLAIYPNGIFKIIQRLKQKKEIDITDIHNYYGSNLDYDIVDNWFYLQNPESFYEAIHKTRLERHKI